MQSRLKKVSIISIVVFLVWLSGCKPEEFTTSSEDKLNFSTDTILFDTILSQIQQGTPKSVNRQFLVKNNNDKRIKTNIRLAGGDKSVFRLNVDGDPGINFENIEIRAHDSIFVFVEAYANPNNNPAGNPLIIRDSIVFETNGNLQDVKLVAWGQDAIYYFKDSTETDMVWADKTKPYVIYDYFYVKPGATLTIKEGVKVYFSPYSTLYTEGTLKIEGTNAEPVTFEGDRTSDKYSDRQSFFKYYNIPGQWFGLSFAWPSKGNSIKHARIKNATIGIYLDSSTADGQATVKVYNTMVQNITYNALRGTRSNVYIENSVLANCGSACLYTFKGGDYDLKHCTVSGFCDFGGTNDPALAITNRLRNEFGQVLETYELSFTILNSIVWGNQLNEFYTDIEPTKLKFLSPLHSIIKTSNQSLGQAGTNNKLNVDPKFKDYVKYNFDLDTLSPAKDIGIPLIPLDFNSKVRDAKPDAGAAERFE